MGSTSIALYPLGIRSSYNYVYWALPMYHSAAVGNRQGPDPAGQPQPVMTFRGSYSKYLSRSTGSDLICASTPQVPKMAGRRNKLLEHVSKTLLARRQSSYRHSVISISPGDPEKPLDALLGSLGERAGPLGDGFESLRGERDSFVAGRRSCFCMWRRKLSFRGNSAPHSTHTNSARPPCFRVRSWWRLRSFSSLNTVPQFFMLHMNSSGLLLDKVSAGGSAEFAGAVLLTYLDLDAPPGCAAAS
jgi:hypothetical protein